MYFGRSADENREKYNLLLNKIQIFIDERIYFHEGLDYKNYKEFKDFIHDKVVEFCIERQLPVPSKDTVSKILKPQIEFNCNAGINKKDFTFDGKRVKGNEGKKYVYYGIQYLTDEYLEMRDKKDIDKASKKLEYKNKLRIKNIWE